PQVDLQDLVLRQPLGEPVPSRLEEADEPAVPELEALLPGLHRDLHLAPRNFADPIVLARRRRDSGRTDPAPQAASRLPRTDGGARPDRRSPITSVSRSRTRSVAGTRTRGTPDPTGRRRSVPANISPAAGTAAPPGATPGTRGRRRRGRTPASRPAGRGARGAAAISGSSSWQSVSGVMGWLMGD